MNGKEIDITGAELITERLILRPFRKEDIDDFYEYAKVEGVGEAAGWTHHADVSESKSILEMFIRGHHTFAVTLKAGGKVIGSVGIEQRSSAITENFPDKKINEIGYVLSKDYWGNGLMTEAVKAVIAYMFEVLGLDGVACAHFEGNTRSRRVIEKCGFTYYGEGVFNASYGKTERCFYYLLTRKVWLCAR